jgi:hypothetical protein
LVEYLIARGAIALVAAFPSLAVVFAKMLDLFVPVFAASR